MKMIQRKQGDVRVFVRPLTLTDLVAHTKAHKPVTGPEKIRKCCSEN